jgi:hypothetical protein
LIDTARIDDAGSGPQEAAALPPAVAWYKVAEATDGTRFPKKAWLLASRWRDANGLAAAPTVPVVSTGTRCAVSWAAGWSSARPRRGANF